MKPILVLNLVISKSLEPHTPSLALNQMLVSTVLAIVHQNAFHPCLIKLFQELCYDDYLRQLTI